MSKLTRPFARVVFSFLQLAVVAVGLTKPDCPANRDTTCVGYDIDRFASGGNISQILGDLSDRFCGCTHVIGSIRIDLATSETGVQELTEDYFNFFYYLEEISDVLTFTNFPPTSNITFPNLIIIRGEDQIQTAEGDNLVLSLLNTEIGALYMPNLREISQGDVLFLNVSGLCNYRTVNWGDILNNGRLIDLHTSNCQPSDLPDCSACDSGRVGGVDLHNCWSSQYCHILSKVVCEQCGLDRCYQVKGDTLQCCNPLCAAGCVGSREHECHACKDFRNNGTCVTQCPPEIIYNPNTFQLEANPDYRLAAGDLCVEECPDGLFELSGVCLLRCPENFSSEGDKCFACDGPCPVECDGLTESEIVDIFTIERLRGCNIITTGGLFIGSITDPNKVPQYEILLSLQEICGPLRIQGWDGVSFPYLRNLRIIGGENASTLTLSCGGVPYEYSVVIAVDNNMVEIDLSSLEEIRVGGLIFFNNPQLCYTGNFSTYLTDASAHQCISSPRRAADECIADGYECHEQCDSRSNCWGPNDTNCDGCLNFRHQKQCVQNCSVVVLPMDSSGLFQNEASRVCEDCDQECLGGCRDGAGPENCVACRNYFLLTTSGSLCVGECPFGTWLNNVSKDCVPCNVSCPRGCAGPLSYVSLTDGCLECDRVEVDTEGNQVRCLQTGCTSGTYPEILLEGLGDLPAETDICRPCDELCSVCSGPGIQFGAECSFCTYAVNRPNLTVNVFQCVRECENATEYFDEQTRFCNPCTTSCSGCTGSTDSDCIECAEGFMKDIFDTDQSRFKCRDSCDLGDYVSASICVSCDPLCEQCVGPGAANCTECRDQRFTVVLEEDLEGNALLVECFSCGLNEELVNRTCVPIPVPKVPDPPMDVTAFANGARWVALCWQPGFDGNRPILFFVIQRVNLNETNSTYVLVTQKTVGDLMQNNGSFMYNVSNPELILPFTNYRFRVQACNELGCGDFKSSLDIMTEEDHIHSPLCPEETDIPLYSGSSFTYSWKETEAGNTVSQECPVECQDVLRYSEGAALTRQCVQVDVTVVEWMAVDFSGCSLSRSALDLCEAANLLEMDVEAAAVMVVNITANTSEVDALAVSVSSNIVEDLTDDAIENEQVRDSYLDIIDNLIEVEPETIVESQMESNASTKILDSLERFTNAVPIPDNATEVTFTRDNFGIIVQEVDPDTFNGEAFSVNLGPVDGAVTDPEDLDPEDLVRGNDALLNATASVEIPPSIFGNSTFNNSQRLSYSIFLLNSLFLTSKVNCDAVFAIGSVVLSVRANASAVNLTAGLLLNFQQLEQVCNGIMLSESLCANYDSAGRWTRDNCRKVNSGDGMTSCKCSQLGHFGLLFDLNPGESLSPITLAVITYVGAIVSTICLIIVIFTYLYSKKLRTSEHGQLLINLSIALIGLYITFLIAGHVTTVTVLCGLVSALLHYFVLVFFGWTAAEAIHLYQKLVTVLGSEIQHYVLKAALVVWLVPLITVAISVGAGYDYYINSFFCRPKEYPFWFGLILPFGIVYLFDWVMFSIIMASLIKRARKRAETIGQMAQTKRLATAALGLSVVFGLGWGFGLAATSSDVEEVTFTFQVIFGLFVGSQGVLIFILHGLRSSDARHVWKTWFSYLRVETGKKYDLSNSMGKAGDDSTLTSGYPLSSLKKVSQSVCELSKTVAFNNIPEVSIQEVDEGRTEKMDLAERLGGEVS